MNEIDYDALSCAILDSIDESLHNTLNMNTILKSTRLVWDNTAIQVKSNNFTMIFDLINYELMDYKGYDA